MEVWIYTLMSVALVSAISLIGIVSLILKRGLLENILLFLVSFAAGALFGDVFIHLLPEAFRSLGINIATSSYVLGGIVFFFVLEKFVRWRHCHVPISVKHAHPVVVMNLVGDAVHNFIDGMLIGASYMVSVPIGLATTIAVILHEIPQEIGDFGVLIHGGLSINKAIAFNFITALAAVLGSLVSLFVGPHVQNYTLVMLPLTAGAFLYIAGSDLIPELHSECSPWVSFWQFVSMLFGIAVMALLLLLG